METRSKSWLAWLVSMPVLAAWALLGTCSGIPSQLDQVMKLGELRVVTRNSPTSYYLGPEGALGPEYELAREFANNIGVSLYIYTPEQFANVLPDVAAGRAHLAAAGLSATAERSELVQFGSVYQQVSQHLVYRVGSERPRSIEDVIGEHLEVVAGTSHVELLEELRQQYPELTWIENPGAESAELLYKVSQGQIDFTIADSTEFAINRNFHPEIRVGFDVKQGDAIAWAFAPGDDSLRDRADQFFEDIRQDGTLVRIIDRYYGHTNKFDYVGTRTFLRHIETRLPAYRHTFESAAEVTGVDWQLLAAIGYQESHWDPHAISPTGVRGLMMLTQATARHMGIDNRVDPEQSIHGGARYYRRVKNKVPDRIPEPDRTWLTLAAYNVGFGHVEDARILAQMHGKNPDSWAEVREMLPLLSQKKWYSRVKRGYAGGWQPVLYVDNIRNYYDILLWMTSNHMQPFRSEPQSTEMEEPPVET